MLWLFLSLLAAFFAATKDALTKKFIADRDEVFLIGGAFFTTSLFLFAVSYFRGFPQIGPLFFSSLAGTASLNIIAAYLYFRALKIADISLVVPMFAFTPLFQIATSFIMLGEFPTAVGLVGILSVVVGAYFLNFSLRQKGILAPFREIFRNKGVFYMFVVAFLYSITTNFDKLLTLNSDPFFGTAANSFVVGLPFLILSVLKGKRLSDYSSIWSAFAAIGLVTAIERASQNAALTLQIVPYVTAIKRTGAIFGIAYGYFFFREKNIRERLLGAAIMVAGAILILLS